VRYTRHLAAAAVTAITIGSLSSAVLPRSDAGSPDTGPFAQQFADGHAQELSQARLRAQGLADAINADHLRSAELRGADEAAGALVDSLLRRP
jgi:hypothetical protein